VALSFGVREDQASQTARGVAGLRRHFDRVATEYGDPAGDQRLHDDVAGDLPFVDSAFTAYLAARTRFFDHAVVDAVARGCAQVVVAGAGYDGRSLRYATSAVRWFELDHPATLADKSARVSRLGLVSTAAPVGVDFSVDDVGAALLAAGHDAQLPSLMICEGVSPYLDRSVIVRLLESLRNRAAAESQLAMDFSLEPETDDARAARARLRALVEAYGEPFRLEVPRAGLADLLGGAGWRVQEAVDPAGVEMTASDRATVFVTATPAGS
jgi:methyltransferase (TIGR00027 family)